MIRTGLPADFPAIDAFDPFGGSRERELAEQRLRVFEREIEGRAEVIGYLSLAADRFHGNPYVEFLGVAPAHRRAGVGGALLADAEARCAGQRIFLSVEEPNAPMRALVTRFGYQLSGALAGLNDDHGGAAELFYFRDVPGPLPPPLKSA